MKRKPRTILTASRHLNAKPIGNSCELWLRSAASGSDDGTRIFTCDALQNRCRQLHVKMPEEPGAFNRLKQMEDIDEDVESDLDAIIAAVMDEEYRSRIESSSYYHLCHKQPQHCQSVHGQHHKICYPNQRILIGYCNQELFTCTVEYINILLQGYEYPPPGIILHLLQFILNGDEIGGVVKAVHTLSHFISTHPPYTAGMRQYYIDLLTTHCGHEFADMKKSGFLHTVISLLKEITDDQVPIEFPAATAVTAEEEGAEENRNNYETLPREQKVSRLTWILEWIAYALEIDFISFHVKHQDDPLKYTNKEISEPLILTILCKEANVEDTADHSECCVICLIEVWVRANVLQLSLSLQENLMKIIKLIAEAAFLCDFSLGPYPNYGPHCDTLAQQITHALSGLKTEHVLQVIHGIEPEWLAFRVTYLMTCKQVGWMPSETITIENLVNLCFYVLGGIAEEDSDEGEVTSSQDEPGRMSPGTQKERNQLDDTRLKRACSLNDTKTVLRFLREADVDPGVADSCGWTALHEAVVKGSVQCVRALLNHATYGKKPVNIHAKNIDGTTPLMCAVMENNLEVAKLLLRYGGVSILDDENSQGQTAVELATSVEMHKLLSDYAEQFSSNVRVSRLAISLAKQLIPFYIRVYRIENICKAQFQQTVKSSPLVVDLISFKKEIANLKILKYALENLPYVVEYDYLISALSTCRNVKQ